MLAKNGTVTGIPPLLDSLLWAGYRLANKGCEIEEWKIRALVETLLKKIVS